MRRVLPASVAIAFAAALVWLPTSASASAGASPAISEPMNLGAAQAEASGADVTVAVLDTGTAAIPELRGHLTQGKSFISGAALPDEEEHGTSMAYLVLKVAPRVHLLSERVIRYVNPNAKPLTSCPIGDGIRYAVAHGAKVITMSLGSSSQSETAYTGCDAKAVEQALAAGVTIVASAGNNGSPVDTSLGFQPGSASDGEDDDSFPAGYTGVIAVAALTASGSRASFSTVHSYVDIGAPGVRIPAPDEQDVMAADSGTSPAGALVAGVAALILCKAPGLAPWQVEEAMESTAAHPSSWNPKTGYGEVNAAAAVRAAMAMTPASQVQQPVAYTGAKTFGTASEAGPGSGFDTGGALHAAGLFGLALAFFGGAFWLYRRGRRGGGASGGRGSGSRGSGGRRRTRGTPAPALTTPTPATTPPPAFGPPPGYGAPPGYGPPRSPAPPDLSPYVRASRHDPTEHGELGVRSDP